MGNIRTCALVHEPVGTLTSAGMFCLHAPPLLTTMSLEYRTFKRLYATLKSGLGQSSIVDEAYSRDLITRQERDDTNRVGLTLDERNGKILDTVELRIKDDSRNYYVFLEILKQETTFSHLVDKLTRTYKELKDAEDTPGNGIAPAAQPRRATTNPKDPPTIDQLTDHVKTLKWLKLGRKLGVDDFDLAVIGKNNPQDTEDALEETLKNWLRITAKPTWRAVVDALMEIKETQLATKLEEAFC